MDPTATTTRFAPGVTGNLHIGSLANALLNWLKARKTGGRFLLRFDGGNMNEHCTEIRATMRRDLQYFGLECDGEWVYAKNRAELRMIAEDWISRSHHTYACHCTAQDLAHRHLMSPNGPWHRVDRPEKYPPLTYAVKQVWGERADGETIWPIQAHASSEARGTFLVGPQEAPPQNVWRADYVTTPSAHAWHVWRPWSCGFQGPYGDPWLRVEFRRDDVARIGILFPNGAPKRYSVYFRGTTGEATTPGFRPNCWQVPPEDEDRQILHFDVPPGLGELVAVTIIFEEAPLWFLRPYHYDGHCALDPRNYEFKARKKAMQGGETGVIRLASSRFHTAIWFDCAPDLAWYSAWSDRQLDVTHVLRGHDLIPFARLEAPVAEALGYNPQREYHPLIIDRQGTKFSKMLGSPPARSLGTAEQVLGKLAYTLRLVPTPNPISLVDLLAYTPVRENLTWNY